MSLPITMARISPFLKFGLPMVLFCVAGYVGLSKFVEGKVEAVDSRVKKRSERSVQLEMAHKAVVGRMNLEDYEIKPIPKPKEEDELQ